MDTKPEDGWVYFGEHSIRFEPPDFMYFRPVGHMTLEDAHAFIEHVEKCAQGDRGIYLLSDLRRGISQSQDIIKSKDLMKRVRVFRALAYFGASFHARTAMSLYVRVAKFFRFPLADLPLAIFSNEQEARVWLDECRAKATPKT